MMVFNENVNSLINQRPSTEENQNDSNPSNRELEEENKDDNGKLVYPYL